MREGVIGFGTHYSHVYFIVVSYNQKAKSIYLIPTEVGIEIISLHIFDNEIHKKLHFILKNYFNQTI